MRDNSNNIFNGIDKTAPLSVVQVNNHGGDDLYDDQGAVDDDASYLEALDGDLVVDFDLDGLPEGMTFPHEYARYLADKRAVDIEGGSDA